MHPVFIKTTLHLFHIHHTMYYLTRVIYYYTYLVFGRVTQAFLMAWRGQEGKNSVAPVGLEGKINPRLLSGSLQ